MALAPNMGWRCASVRWLYAAQSTHWVVAGVSVRSFEGMRDLLKASLRESLGALPAEDRLAAAWPVACGKAMAGRGTVMGYADGVVRVQVEDGAWLRQLTSIRWQLAREMA